MNKNQVNMVFCCGDKLSVGVKAMRKLGHKHVDDIIKQLPATPCNKVCKEGLLGIRTTKNVFFS